MRGGATLPVGIAFSIWTIWHNTLSPRLFNLCWAFQWANDVPYCFKGFLANGMCVYQSRGAKHAGYWGERDDALCEQNMCMPQSECLESLNLPHSLPPCQQNFVNIEANLQQWSRAEVITIQWAARVVLCQFVFAYGPCIVWITRWVPFVMRNALPQYWNLSP